VSASRITRNQTNNAGIIVEVTNSGIACQIVGISSGMGEEWRRGRVKNSLTNLGGPQEGGKYKDGKTSTRFLSFDGLYVQ